jgi:hypothetical protein
VQLGTPGRIDEDWSTTLASWGGIPALTQIIVATPLFPKLDLAAAP